MQGLSPVPPAPQQPIYIEEDVACYKIVDKRGFFDDTDTLWGPGSLIYWEAEPSMGFEPMNELAEITMREYLEKLDKIAQVVAKEKGMNHINLVGALEANQRLKEMDRKVGRSAEIEEEVSILGIKRKASKGKIKAVNNQPRQAPIMQARKILKKSEGDA